MRGGPGRRGGRASSPARRGLARQQRRGGICRTSAASSRVASVSEVPSVSVRVRTATARRRSGRARRSVTAASSSRQRAPRSTASRDAPSSTRRGPRRTDVDRWSPATAERPAADPAASRSRSCGISASMARRRRASARAAASRRRRPPSSTASGTVRSFGPGAIAPSTANAAPQRYRGSTKSGPPSGRPVPRDRESDACDAASGRQSPERLRDEWLHQRTSRRCRIQRNASASSPRPIPSAIPPSGVPIARSISSP